MDRGKKASALAYHPPLPAPLLLASGTGREAERIISAAREAGVAVVEDPGLAVLLEAARPGDYIPYWCWEAAAAALAFVLEKEASRRESFTGGKRPGGRSFPREAQEQT